MSREIYPCSKFFEHIFKRCRMENTQISDKEKKLKLFNDQKKLLDTFLEKGAITKAQYDTSLNGLKEKMGMESNT